MSSRPLLPLALLVAAAGASAQVFVTNTSNLIAYYSFESNISNQVGGGATHNGTYQVSVTGGIAGDGAGFAGSSAYAGYNNNGGAESTTNRSTLLVGNALNIADNGADGLNNGSGHFYVTTLTSSGNTAVNTTTATLGPNFSIGAWFYIARDADNPANRDFVFEARDNNFDISWGNTGAGNTTYLSYVAQTGGSSIGLAQGQWHQTVHSFSSDGTTTTLSTYVNGVLLGTQTALTANMAFSGINFGHARSSTGRVFDGMLDEVTAWRSTLGAHDAYISYNLGLAGVATNASVALRTKSNDTTALNQSGSWGGTAPASGDLLQFDTTYAQSGSVDLGGNVAVRGLRVTTGSSLVDITASAGTLSVGALGVDMFAAARDLRVASLTVSAGQRWQVASGRTLTVSSLAGSDAVEKIGAGALVLGGGGGFTGTLTLSAGSASFAAGTSSRSLGGLAGAANLALQDASATPAAVALAVGGNNASTTYSGVLSGPGSLTKSGNGTLTLSGANTFSGGVTLSAGALALGDNAGLGTGALTLAGGTLLTSGANRVVANSLVAQSATSSNLGGTSPNDLLLTGAATGSGTLVVNSASSRSVWLQGDWSAFAGTVDFSANTGGTNLRLGGVAGTTTVADGANASDFSQARFSLSGAGTDRMVIWNGTAGQTVQIGELSGAGGRIGVGSGRAANWQVGALGTSSTFGGVLEGAGNALTKVGAGTLTLSGANTHGGGTSVNAGTLNITGATGGAVTVNAGATLSGTGALSGAVTVNAGGALSLANGAASTFALGSLSLDAAALTLELGDLLNLGAGDLALAGETSLTLAGPIAAGTYQLINFGSQSGIGTLSLVTPGRFSATPTLGATGYSVVLASPNLVWNGGTGTWDGSAENWLLNAGATNFQSGEDVTIGGSSDQTLAVADGITPGNVTLTPSAGTTTLAGAGFAGIGSVTKSGAGTAVLAAPIATTGAIAVNQGTLRLAEGGSLLSSAALSVADGATFDLDGRSQTLGSLAGSGSVALGSGALTVSSSGNSSFAGALSGSGSLTKSGAGTLTLSGASAHTGATTVSAGTVTLANQSALGSSTLVLSGGSAAFDASVAGNAFAVGGLAGSSSLALANNAGSPAAVALTVGANNASTTYSGVLSGAGSLAKSGTGSLTLSGANSHTGGTTVDAGALLVGHASALGSGALALNGGALASSSSTARTLGQSVSFGGDVILGQASGGTGALEFTGAVDLGAATRTVTTVSTVTLRGNLSNGSLIKAGDGTLVLGGTPSLDALTVTAGRTLVTGAAGLGNAVVTLAGGELVLRASGDLAGNLVLSGSAASNRLSLGLEVDYLVVGGGGGGAGRDSSGGGGGGGVLSNLLGGGSPLLLASGSTAVVVGAGGAGAVGPDGSGLLRGDIGGSSSLGSVAALGGGGGGGYGVAGSAGATGGGSGRQSAVSVAGTAGQGFAGGAGSGGSSSTVDAGGGGGGAGEAGQAGIASSKGGDGGDGLAVSITGSEVYYGGGGGGSPHRNSTLSGGAGGLGGGGAAATSSSVGPSSGVANTGGGGGASRSDVTGRNSGGAGGSGVVIVRYLGDAVATGGTITSGTGSAAGYTLHTFASVGEAQLTFVGDRRVTGVVSGSGGFTFATPGHRLFLDSTNTYSGGTVVAGGTLVAAAAGALGSGSVTVNSGGILQAAAVGALGSAPVTLSSGGRLVVSSVGGVGSSSVTAGSGSLVSFRTDGLTLAQMSTEASAVTWQTGSQLALDTSGGDFTLDQEFQSDATLAKTGSNNLVFAVADSARAGNLALVEGGIRLAAANALGSGTLTLAAGTSLAADGVAARSAGNALVLQGDVTVGSGGDAQPSLTLSGTVDLGGANRTLTVASSATLSGTIANGGLTKAGGSDLTLSGSNSFAGGLALSAGALRVGSDAALGVGTLTLAGGSLASSSVSARSLANAVAVAGDVTLGDASANGLLSLSGAVNLGGATRALTTASDVTLSGVVSNGGLTKAGAGTLTLSGATTFAGPLTVSAGTLRLTGSNANGSASVSVQSGATLDLRGGQGLFRTGAFAGETTHVTVSGGTLVVDKFDYGDDNNFNQLRNNYYSLSLAGGGRIRHVASESFLRAVTIGAGGAVFETDAGVTVTKLAGSAGSQNLTRFSANSALTFAGAGTYILQDSLAPASWGNTGFSIAKQDAGTLRLTGANLHTGGTSVTGGVLEFASGSLGSSGAISVDGGALRWLAGNTQDISSRLTLSASGSATLDTNGNNVTLASGFGSGSGSSLTKAGAGVLTLGGAAGHSGATTVANGTLRLGAAGSLSASASLAVDSGATFDLNGRAQTLAGLAGSGAIALGAGTLTVSGSGDSSFAGVISGSGGLAKAGAGTLTLDAANSYAGSTVVAGGVLRLGAAGSLAEAASLTVDSGATFDLNGRSQSLSSLAGAGTISLGAGHLTLANSSTVVFSGSIVGSGSLTKAGAGILSLAAPVAHTGGTVVLEGDLELAAADVLLASSPLDVRGGRLNLGLSDATVGAVSLSGGTVTSEGSTLHAASVAVDNSAGSVQLLANVVVSGAFTKAGAGALQVDSALSAASLSVSAGSISGAGSLAAESFAVTNAAGTVTVSAALADGFSAAGLTKTGAGVLVLSGANTFSGGLAVDAGRVDVADLAHLGSGAVALGSAGTLRLSLDLAAGSLVLSDSLASGLSGSGTLDLNLAGENAFSLGALPGFGGSVRLTSGVFDHGGFSGDIVFAGGRLLDSASFAGPVVVAGAISDLSQLPVTAGGLVLQQGGSVDFSSLPTPFAGAVTLQGGTVTGGANLSGRIQLAPGLSLVLGSGLDELASAATLVISAGASVDLAGSATGATLEFTGGSLAGAENFSGTLAVAGGATLSTDGTVGGTVTLASGTTLAGNGTFTGTVNVGAGSTLAPGSSPGLLTVDGGVLNLTGGSSLNLEFFSTQENIPGVGRGYDSIQADTLNFGTAGEPGGGTILLRLATLTNWSDVITNWDGTNGFVPAEGSSLILAPGDLQKEFVIARFEFSDRSGSISAGDNISSWFSFDADLFEGTGASGFQVFLNSGDSTAWQLTLRAIPEPSTYGLILGGFALAGAALRRRGKNSR